MRDRVSEGKREKRGGKRQWRRGDRENYNRERKIERIESEERE